MESLVIKELEKPLPPSAISTRAENRGPVNYIEGYFAIDNANRIFGYGNWSKKITRLECIRQDEVQAKSGVRKDVMYICVLSVSVDADGEMLCSYEDVGYGSGQDYNDWGKAHEKASKEAVTDATKRCLRHFGSQFGNELYDKEFRIPTDDSGNGTAVKPTAKQHTLKPAIVKQAAKQDDHDPTVWSKVIEIIDSGLSENAYINYAKVAKKTHEKAGKWVAADSDPQKWAKWIVGQDWYKELLNKVDEDDASVLDAMNMNPL
jgi:DNA repair and recombination protein RAD52